MKRLVPLQPVGDGCLMMAIRTAHTCLYLLVCYGPWDRVKEAEGFSATFPGVLLDRGARREEAFYEDRSARRMILPVVVRGNSSRKVTWLGVSWAARRVRTWSFSWVAS